MIAQRTHDAPPDPWTSRTPLFLRAGWRWLRSQAIHPPVGYLVLFLNTRCEQNCRHCFVRPEDDNNLLTPVELTHIGGQLRGLIQLTITGGEPTLRPDFIPAVKAIARQSGVPFISVHSNGLDSERTDGIIRHLLEALPRQRLSWRISLDGMGSLHDQIRRRPGSWDATVDTLRTLSRIRTESARFRFYVDTCVSSRNETQLLELADFLAATFPRLDGWEVTQMRGVPRDPRTRPAINACAEARRALAQRERPKDPPGWFERPGRAALQEVYRRVQRTLQGEIGALRCVAGERFLVVGPSGEISPCETLETHGRLGDLRSFDCDLHALLATPTARNRIHGIKSGLCAAGCTEECPALATITLRGTALFRALLLDMTEKANR
jgi:MoaA/NifB/PqqE/SkfB family radical SAM enzyme